MAYTMPRLLTTEDYLSPYPLYPETEIPEGETIPVEPWEPAPVAVAVQPAPPPISPPLPPPVAEPALSVPVPIPAPAPSVQPQPQPSPMPQTGGGTDFRSYARSAAARAGVDPDIFERQIQQESGFNPGAHNPSGANGIAQIMPFHNVNSSDPYASLDYAANLMASHLKTYNQDYAKALAAYNAGPGNVAKYGGVPPFAETLTYIKNILGGSGGGGGSGGAQPLSARQPIAEALPTPPPPPVQPPVEQPPFDPFGAVGDALGSVGNSIGNAFGAVGGAIGRGFDASNNFNLGGGMSTGLPAEIDIFGKKTTFPQTLDQFTEQGADLFGENFKEGVPWGSALEAQIRRPRARLGASPEEVRAFDKDFYARFGDTLVQAVLGMEGAKMLGPDDWASSRGLGAGLDDLSDLRGTSRFADDAGVPPPPAPPPSGTTPDTFTSGTEGNLKRGFSETLETSPNSSEALRGELADNPLTYEGPRDTQALSDRARARVDADPDGVEKALLGKRRNYNDEDVADGIHLIVRLTQDGATAGELQRGVSLASVLAEDLTEAGKKIQAVRIQNALSESGALLRMQKARQAVRSEFNEETAIAQEERVTKGIVEEKARKKTKDIDEDIQSMATQSESAQGRQGTTTTETKTSKSLRSRLEAAIKYLEGDRPAPKPGSPEADLLNRMKRLAKETGWELPHPEAKALLDLVEGTKKMPKAERVEAHKTIIKMMEDDYLPVLESRSSNFRQSRDLLKRTQESVNYVNLAGRLPRQVAPLKSVERAILDDLKRLADKLGYQLPDDLALKLNNAIEELKKMDVGSAERILAAQKFIREEIGGGIVNPLREMETFADKSNSLIKKAGQTINELANAGRNPKQPGLTDEAIKRLSQAQRNANSIGYLLPPARLEELASWLDDIKSLPFGPEREAAIRGYIDRLTTGDVASEIAEATQQFKSARKDIGRVERIVTFLGDLGRNPGSVPGLVDADAKAFARMEFLSNKLGHVIPSELRTDLLKVVDELRGMPEGPLKVEKARRVAEAIHQRYLPDLEARYNVFKDEKRLATWEEHNLKYLMDEAERITKPQVREDVKATMDTVRTLLREGGVEASGPLSQWVVDQTRLARSFPEGSADRYLVLKGISRAMSDLVPPSLWDKTAKYVNLPRQAMTGLWDLSALLRQGRYGLIAHPTSWFKALRPMFEALKDPQVAAEIEAQIATRPNAKFWEDAGAFLAERGPGAGLSAREERFLGRAMGYSDGRSGLFKRLMTSEGWEDAYVTFLNKLRADILDNIYTKYEKRGTPLTLEEAQNYAQSVNWMTGRGSLPTSMERTAGVLGQALFSPRNLAARVERPFAAARAAGTLIAGPGTPMTYATRRIAGEIGKDFGAYYGVMYGLLGTAALAGLAVGDDPRKGNFGSIKIGDVEYSLLGDDAALMRALARFGSGEEVTRQGGKYPVNRGDVITKYIANQLVPQIGMVWNQVTGQDSLGRDITGPARNNTLAGSLNLNDDLGEYGGRISDVAEHMLPGVVDAFTSSVGNDLALGDIGGSVGASFLGVNNNVQVSMNEMRDKVAIETTGKLYGDLPPRDVAGAPNQSQAFVNASPRVKTLLDDMQAAQVSKDPRQLMESARLTSEDAYKRLEESLRPTLETNGYKLNPATANLVQEYRKARYQTSQAIYGPAVQAALAQGKGKQTPLEMARDEYLSVDAPIDPLTGEPDFKKRDKTRAEVLQRWTNEGLNPAEITSKKAQSSDPKFQAVLDEYDRLQEVVRPYYAIADNLQAKTRAYAEAVAKHDQLERAAVTIRGQEALREFNRTNAVWRRYTQSRDDQRAILRNKNKELNAAGVALGNWSPIPPEMPSMLPEMPELPELPSLPEMPRLPR